MSSDNFLSVKSQLSELKLNNDKDAQSEASESSASTSVTSGEDLQKIAVILGIQNIDDVHQERFRIDRRRLEAMLAENLEENQTANAFFHKVMTDTNTVISWPTRLKVGARSKKDPHVRVAGRVDDVKVARDKIMQLLDTRSNRVTMKLDISYTDHSHIIGKGGLTIKRVMEETGCHIHFPDSNRASTQEKSNQVSIAGDMDKVEIARARLRALTPLIFSFELPITGSAQPQPDLQSPYVQQIMELYNVQVMLRTRSKLHSMMVAVKGVQWEVQATMEATRLLIDYLCGPLAAQTLVTMSVEISAMHHAAVLGAGGSQLKAIMANTGTQIIFPDASDPNVPTIKRSNVTIQGHINDVYLARQQIIGSLPIVVIFEMVEEGAGIESEVVSRLQHQHAVLINVRRKPRHALTSVVLKGVERAVGDIYAVRRELLGNIEAPIKSDIPDNYHIPVSASAPSMPFHSPDTLNQLPSPQASPILAAMAYNQLPSFMGAYCNPNTQNAQYCNPPTPGGYPTPISPVYPQPWGLIHPNSPQPQTNPFTYPNTLPVPQQGYGPGNGWNNSNMGRVVMTQPQYTHSSAQPTTLSQVLNASSAGGSSGYQSSNFTGSTMSLDTHSLSGCNSGVASPSVSPMSKTASPAPEIDPDRSQEFGALMASELGIGDWAGTGKARNSPMADYHNMRIQANKVLEEGVGGGYRVPTSRWSGYFFSNTSPAPLARDDAGTAAQLTPDRQWNSSDLVRPNIVETTSKFSPKKSSPAPIGPPYAAEVRTPTGSPPKPCRYEQLYSMLTRIGLPKYVDLFRQHEIDISTFATLNEADLTEIGVTAFGARRKMLLVINDLKKQQQSPYKGSVAPGAERAAKSPQYDTGALQSQDKW